MMRIGLGFDLHRLEEGRPCILGGVELPHPSGPAGHSDGDAVLHALVDAVTGAAGLDDVGTLFPDDDERWKGADSAELLRAAVELAREAGFEDITVEVATAPDMEGRLLGMIETVAGYARDSGDMSEQSIDEVLESVKQAIAAGTYLALAPQFLLTAKV